MTTCSSLATSKSFTTPCPDLEQPLAPSMLACVCVSCLTCCGCLVGAVRLTLAFVLCVYRYGFSIMGGDIAQDGSGAASCPPTCSPIFVSKIKPGTPSDGTLKIGTQIISINGVCVVGMMHSQVCPFGPVWETCGMLQHDHSRVH